MFNKVECICLNEFGSAPPIISLILTSDPGQVFKMVNCEVIVCICGNENIKEQRSLICVRPEPLPRAIGKQVLAEVLLEPL